MKKLKFLLVALMFVCLTGCFFDKENTVNEVKKENTVVNYKDNLTKVLKGESKFIDEDNNSVLLTEYKLPSEELAVEKSHAFVDLDNDGNEELVVYTTSDYGAYLIFHYEDNNVYGYLLGIRSFEDLKKDGSFMGSNGANSSTYMSISFNKNKYILKEEAVYDDANNSYKINDKEVTKEEIDEYVQNWNLKEEVVFTEK